MGNRIDDVNRGAAKTLSRWGVTPLLALAACGHPEAEILSRQLATERLTSAEPRPADTHFAWHLKGTWRGDAGGTSHAFMHISPAGDEDRDGVSDLLLGLPYAQPRAGAQGQVRILSGTDLSTLRTLDGEVVEAFGYAAARLGDVNGDGRTDYAIGAPVVQGADGGRSFKGRAYVALSEPGGKYSRTVLTDTEEDGYFGRSLAFAEGAAGSVLVVSRPKFLGGRALGYSLPISTTSKPLYVASNDALNNDTINERRGYFIHETSDLDQDGTRDFLMLASGQDPSEAPTFPYPGRVYFHSGRTGDLLRIVEGPTPTTQLGVFAVEIDDIDQDGATDFLIGAPYARIKDVQMAGAAYVVSGRAVRGHRTKLLSLASEPAAILREHTGTSSVSLLGYATSALFDLDRDGIEEYAIGAPGVTTPIGRYAGRVLVYSGRTGRELHTFEGDGANVWLGEGLLADRRARSLYIATWHADGYNGRVLLYRWTRSSRPLDD